MKEGLIPTTLGAIVTVGAVVLRARDMKKRGVRQKNIIPMFETAVLGFGLAHIILGGIDLLEHK